MYTETAKQTVFISYAHKDKSAVELTQRLADALELFSQNVFWDSKLQTGDFTQQLFTQIEASEFFISVMSPHASESEYCWCRRELRHAEFHNIPVITVKVYSDYRDSELESKYKYADFTQDFEQGFRQVTFYMFDQRYSSWEVVEQYNDEEILENLKSGKLPVVVSKEIAEWTIVENLWPELYLQLPHKDIIIGAPKTPAGILRETSPIETQLCDLRNFRALHVVKEAKSLVENYIHEVTPVNDQDHKKSGEIAAETIEQVKKFIEMTKLVGRDYKALWYFQPRYYFNIAEKLRELTLSHARKSRYLY